MLDDDHRVAQIAQLFQHADQPCRVPRMQSDARLVENVERSDQAAAQRRGQIDPLALASGQRRGEPVERQVTETHLVEVLQPVADFGQHAPGRFAVPFVELQSVEKGCELFDRHGNQFGDVLAPYPHVQRFLAEPCSLAVGADGFSGVARQHDAVLYLVAFAFEVFEELVQSVKMLVPFPQQMPLLARELVERPVDGEVEFRGVQNQLLPPPFHRFAPPAGDSVLIDTFGLVGHDQVLVDADHFAVTFAPGAGSHRIVETEHMLGRLLERDAVQLETRRETLDAICPLLQDDDLADAVSVPKRVLDRVSQPAQRFLVGRSPGPVDDDGQIVSSGVVVRAGDHLLDEKRFASGMDTLHSLADEQCQLLDQPLPFGQLQRSRYQYACPFGQRGDPVHDVGHRVAADLPARYGRIGASDAREEQFQVVVDFGRRADGRARIPRVDLLLDRDGRSDSGNQVDVGLVDLAQKLAGVGRQAFDVASLALGEDGVERERRLARARQSGYDDQLVMGYLDLYVLEIMYPGAFDVDVFPFFRVVHASIPNRPLKITNFSQNYYPRTERFDKRPVRLRTPP